jgi:peptidoglycan/LPS O-acetylase OafA/YrhL
LSQASALTEQKASHLREKPRVRALDGIRGLAVLVVMCYHLGGGAHSNNTVLHAFGTMNKMGYTGVTLFFVLSGFLITGILWDSRGTPHWWRSFFIRRSLRIFPLYYASLLLVVIVALVVGHLHQCLSRIWTYVLYLQRLSAGPEGRDIDAPLRLGHFWSLAVEEQFYLLWPWLLRWIPDRLSAKLLCIGIFVFSCLYRLITWTVAIRFAAVGDLPTYSGALALGAWLALSYRGPEWVTLERRMPVVAWTSGCGFLATAILSGSLRPDGSFTPMLMIIGLPLVMIFFGALIALALQEGIIRRIAETGILRWLGGISYAAYVFHVLFMDLFAWLANDVAAKYGRNAVLGANFVIGMSLTLLLAWLSGRYFEAPFLRLKEQFPQIRSVHAGSSSN